MKAGDLVKLLRNELNDRSAPYLWSDDELYEYVDCAQVMFARLTNGIPDSSSSICVQDVVEGDPVVVLHPKILRIRQARYVSNEGEPTERNRFLTLVNPEDLELGRPGFHEDYGPQYGFGFDYSKIGRADYLLTGADATQARLINIPDSDGRIYLTVQRLPLKTITCKDDTFEIPEQHHRYLSYYAQHLAYLKQDAETFDRTRSAEAEEQFLQYCDLARRERERREHTHRGTSFSW